MGIEICPYLKILLKSQTKCDVEKNLVKLELIVGE